MQGLGSHIPPEHVSPELHELPLQHCWVAPPHGGPLSGAGAAQMAPLHVKPMLHALPLQHGCPEPPQTCVQTEDPLHMRPELHAVPQQD